MSAAALLILTVLNATPGKPPVIALSTDTIAPAPPSNWFAEDKLKHFFASFVVSSLSSSAGRTAGLGSDESLAVGAGIGATAGLIKERQDARTGGVFSGADLLWDAAGLAAAFFLARSAE